MPADDTDPLLRRMREHVRTGGSGRSRLSAWMAAHQSQIAEMIATYGAAWEAWAASFVDAGLMAAPAGWGADGPEGARARRRAAGAARMAWQRLCRRRAGARPAPIRSGTRPAPSPRTATAPAVTRNGETSAAMRRLLALDRELKERSR